MMKPREPKNDVDRSDDSALDMFSGRFDSYDGMDNYRSSSDYK